MKDKSKHAREEKKLDELRNTYHVLTENGIAAFPQQNRSLLGLAFSSEIQSNFQPSIHINQNGCQWQALMPECHARMKNIEREAENS